MLFLAVAFLAFAETGASARGQVDAALRAPSIDLMPMLEKMQTDQPEVTIKVSESKGPGTLMTLQAKGPGPVYRWAVVSMLKEELS